ncbi:hypothetical protein [Pseudomonas abieticivorans]|uniref:hypothetical protein n=1 Tax=Pseudomonas abieticivorans TaxID=2931382 RepID=UPI0020C1631A|nr:hypothetical protein [Pseudomonas sp. PIA16]
MLIMGQANQSQIALCLDAAHLFLLDRSSAKSIVLTQLETVRQHWSAVCTEAWISIVDRNVLATRQVLNPFVFEQLPEADRDLAQRAEAIRRQWVAATFTV